MKNEKFILVKTYCEHSKVEERFVQELNEYGLVHWELRQSEAYIDADDISRIERMFRLNHELGINIEGLDAVENILERLHKMEKEMKRLRAKLDLYE